MDIKMDIKMDSKNWKEEILFAFHRPGVINYNYYIAAEFKKDGKFHNIDFPAEIEYCEDGNIIHKKYYIEGKLHREDGPARIEYNQKGNIIKTIYFLEDNPQTFL